jgi:hypothetical protein
LLALLTWSLATRKRFRVAGLTVTCNKNSFRKKQQASTHGLWNTPSVLNYKSFQEFERVKAF